MEQCHDNAAETSGARLAAVSSMARPWLEHELSKEEAVRALKEHYRKQTLDENYLEDDSAPAMEPPRKRLKLGQVSVSEEELKNKRAFRFCFHGSFRDSL